MTLVPAVLAMLGDRAWWLPGWLDRRLPVLDVEGVGLERHLAHDAWTREHGAAVVRAEGLRVEDTDGSVVLDGVDAVVRPGRWSWCTPRTGSPAARCSPRSPAGWTCRPGRWSCSTACCRRRRPPYDAGSRCSSASRLDELEALGGRRRNDDPVLVVVDDVDFFASDDEPRPRWQALRRLTERGVAVLAGATHLPADGDAGVVHLDTPATPTTSTRTDEEASL